MVAIPWFIALPLRKAALIPVLAITAVAVGSTYGSWDLASRVVGAALRKPEKRRKSTKLWASGGSLLSMAGTAALHEALFRPTIIPPPDLPLDGVPLDQRVKNAAAVVGHQIRHYPYKHRLSTGFLSGTVGGVVYALIEWGYNRGKLDKADKPASPQQQQQRLGGGGEGGDDMALTSLSVDDDETAVHTDDDVAGMGYDSAKEARAREESSGAPPTRPGVRARQAYVHEQGGDPLAALGLYGYSVHHAPPPKDGGAGQPEDMLDHLAAAAAEAAAATRRGDGPSSGGDDGFLESYSDKYKDSGAGDSARALESGEGSSGPGGQWDPYAGAGSSIAYDSVPVGK